jgi:hypothetical protein
MIVGTEAARRTWADPGLRAEYARHRPNVERAVAQVATRGVRRLNYATEARARTMPGSNAAPPP